MSENIRTQVMSKKRKLHDISNTVVSSYDGEFINTCTVNDRAVIVPRARRFRPNYAESDDSEVTLTINDGKAFIPTPAFEE